MADFDPAPVRAALRGLFAGDAVVRLCHPFGQVIGAEGLWHAALAPLAHAWPDLERRDYIVMAGQDEHGLWWLGAGGFWCGTFTRPWLDIPPTGHLAHMRFHEFYRFDGDRVVEVQALWDIPEVMMQAGAWPLAPSLGREWCPPAPQSCDGIVPGPYDEARSLATRQHIIDMLAAMKRHPAEPEEAMEMPRFWHEKLNWYGPAGIGTGRGIRGFRQWHQIPFLRAMPDRGRYVDEITYHFFADGDYAAVTGWPNMIQTLSHDGWLGIAPVGRRVTMRSLDFWRRGPDGRIRENWVMVDLLDLFDQIGVDAFARMREFNKARAGFDPETGKPLSPVWEAAP
ncbi:MAG: polyketide cyclase [Alphaproteobacteria bacterium]|nr:MAG: polyketide cyclase [Alphaproteobacteria bacterium]